jgi:hypothetical protein
MASPHDQALRLFCYVSASDPATPCRLRDWLTHFFRLVLDKWPEFRSFNLASAAVCSAVVYCGTVLPIGGVEREVAVLYTIVGAGSMPCWPWRSATFLSEKHIDKEDLMG